MMIQLPGGSAPLAHPRDTGPPQSNMAVEDSTLEFDDFSALMKHDDWVLFGMM